MQLRFNPSRIKSLADRYVNKLSQEEYDEELTIINLKKTIQESKCMTKVQLILVGKWKTKRKSKPLLDNTDRGTREITERAFTETDDWRKLQILTKLEGIGQARSSAILHLYDKNVYPILDMHANFSIGFEREPRAYYRKDFWIDYIKLFRDLVDEHNITDHRQLDRAFWRYSFDESIKENSRRSNCMH